MEFWFEYGSNYSYVSVMRIEAAAKAAGVELSWHPFLLGPIFKDQGWDTSPFVLQKAKGAFMWRDMERQCLKYNLPWRKPSVFPRSGVLAARVALLGGDWVPELSRRIMTANFAEDREIGEPAVVSEILESMGLAHLLAEANAESNKPLLRAQTERAKAKGIFGAPTFFVGNEMYWGNDRLDDALTDAGLTTG